MRHSPEASSRQATMDLDMSENSEDEEEDDDDDVQAVLLEGSYDPKEFEHLAVSPEMKEFFEYITFVGISVGAVLAWTSAMVARMKEGSSPLLEASASPSALGSLVPLGALLGPLVAAIFLHTQGRRWALIISALCFLTGWLLLIFPSSLVIVYSGRFISGIGMGMSMMVAPVFNAEILPVQLRGAVISSLQSFTNIGYLLEYCLGPFIDYYTLLVISAIPAILLLGLSILCLKESPYYLVANKRINEAEFSLSWYSGSCPHCKAKIPETISSMQSSAQWSESMSYKLQMKSLLTTRGHLQALTLVCCLFLFLNFSGMPVIVSYTEPIFLMSGVSISSSLSSILVGLDKFIVALALPFLTKKFGVKNMIILSASFMSVTLLSLGTFFFLKDEGFNLQTVPWLPLTSLIFYYLFSGLTSLPFVVMGEMLDSSIKPAGVLISGTFNFILLFLTFLLFNIFVSQPYISFWLFSLITSLCIPFTIFFLPETRGMTLEEIQTQLQSHSPKHINAR